MRRRAFLLVCAAAIALVSCQSPRSQKITWIGTYEMGPVGIPQVLNIGPHRLPAPVTVPGTIRYRVRVSQGGSQVRISLSNEFNTAPMTIVSASVAIAGEGLDAVPGSLHALTFSGKQTVTLPVEGVATSDAVELSVPTLGDLLVTVYAPGGITWIATNRASKMDPGMAESADASLMDKWPVDRHVYARPMISAVEVLTDKPTRVVVALGDSITDGSVDSRTGDRGWPGALSRIVAERNISVVNAGINSNRLLKSGDFFAPSGPARLDRDVFSVQGITHLIVLEGINDIGMGAPDSWFGESSPVRAEDLIAALRQIIDRAHRRGIKVIGATIIPFEGAPYYAAEKEKTRLAVNDWIRTSGAYDGIVDFDAAVRDPGKPGVIKSEFDSGDHLHPNAAGCRAMARAIDLRLLGG